LAVADPAARRKERRENYQTTGAQDPGGRSRGPNARTPWFDECLRKYRELDKAHRLPLREEDFYVCLGGNTANTGFDTHYEYHLGWAARKLAELKPPAHVDISSRITFNTILSAVVPITFCDYRPAKIKLPGLSCGKADLVKLPFADGSIESLSCMHTVEHIGLGRYGDAIDPEGDLKAMRELARVLKPGGSLLFVVPVGKPRIQFNAHRIYSYEMILEAFDGLRLAEFSLIPDDAIDVGMIVNATAKDAARQSYGCGCFWFRK
jgi:SAM-dependent methyltransferase